MPWIFIGQPMRSKAWQGDKTHLFKKVCFFMNSSSTFLKGENGRKTPLQKEAKRSKKKSQKRKVS
jgi:hypothetical protein